jgi:hypothetical protein
VILVVKELFWWSEITILAGIVLAYLIHFPVGLEFFNLPVFRKGNSPGHKAAVSAGT